MPTYYNEKTKKYYCKFYYTDWQGIRRQKKKEGFTLARDAKAYEQEFLNKTAGDCSMKFAALYDIYITDFKARHKPTTVNQRVYDMENTFCLFGRYAANSYNAGNYSQMAKRYNKRRLC